MFTWITIWASIILYLLLLHKGKYFDLVVWELRQHQMYHAFITWLVNRCFFIASRLYTDIYTLRMIYDLWFIQQIMKTTYQTYDGDAGISPWLQLHWIEMWRFILAQQQQKIYVSLFLGDLGVTPFQLFCLRFWNVR